jgi:tryptophan synthase alpha chain
MSRIAATFDRLRRERRAGLITYTTAGDPDLRRSGEVLLALDRAGADVLEVGVPFSDPMADGPVIQRAAERALRAGSNLNAALDLIDGVRPRLDAAVVVFTYANPIFKAGVEAFAARAARAGVDGVLVLDLPIEEAESFRTTVRAVGVDTIFLLSPTTTEGRMRRAAELGSGFLYGISRLGVTGARDRIAAGAAALVRRIRSHSSLPVALGFGISRPEHVAEAAGYADAVVVGSALVSVIAEHGQSDALTSRVADYVRWLKSGLTDARSMAGQAEL